jgi:hypothetical protein
MILAALGHDLYEDEKRKIRPPDMLKRKYGSAVHQLIQLVTEDGDKPLSAYVEQVATGPEEAILIKLCDGISNYRGLVRKRKLQEKPQYWIDIVQKKMEPMFSRLDGFEFKTYRAAGPSLAQQLQTRREQFWFCAAQLGYSK